MTLGAIQSAGDGASVGKRRGVSRQGMVSDGGEIDFLTILTNDSVRKYDSGGLSP